MKVVCYYSSGIYVLVWFYADTLQDFIYMRVFVCVCDNDQFLIR